VKFADLMLLLCDLLWVGTGMFAIYKGELRIAGRGGHGGISLSGLKARLTGLGIVALGVFAWLQFGPLR
jgi:hypothetical protein